MRLDLPDEFCFNVHKLRHMSVITVYGEIDVTNVHLLEEAVDHLACREVPLLFDLTRVRYIDSTGLHFMRRVHDQCARHRVPCAIVTNAMVRRICGLLSLETLVPIFTDATLARDHIAAEWEHSPSDARAPS